MQNKYSYIILIIIVAGLYTGCSKEAANTKPTLKFKSFTPERAAAGSAAQAVLEFTDKEADLDSIYVYKQRTNRQVTATIRDSFRFSIPAFNKTTSGEIVLDFEYQNHLISAINPPVSGTPPSRQPDSLIFKFFIKDKAGNKSDTAFSSLIVIQR